MAHRRTFRELIWISLVVLTACAPLGAPQAAMTGLSTDSASPTPSALVEPLPAAAATPGTPSISKTPYVSATPRADRPAAANIASHPVPSEMHKALELAYTHTPGVNPHLQSLDVYYSEPVSAHRRVMLYVHGGGWTAGDKVHVDFKSAFFVKAGYVFISVNYRLSPEAQFPAHVQDIAAAIAWTRKNIGQYGGDPNEIFLSGHSAGGHLATLVATDERYLKEQGLSLDSIKGVVSIDTAGYDFSVFASRCKNYILPEPYSIAFGQNPADWKLASPVTYITAGKRIPPMALIFSGDVGIGSEVLREQMAREFGEKLSASQIFNRVFGAREKNHGQINEDFGSPANELGLQTLEFLDSLLPNS